MYRVRSRFVSALVRGAGRAVVAAVVLAPLAVSPAQASAQVSPDDRTETELLIDFIHFVRIGNYAVAGDLGQELLDRGLDPVEFVDLVERSGEGLDRYERALA